jgi:hypothetical protein
MTVVNGNLEKLQKRYSSALYSYFRITNLLTSIEKFSADPTQPPVFHYTSSSTPEKAAQRIKNLKKELKSQDLDEASIAFIDWRIAETKVLQKFWHLKQQKTGTSNMVNSYLAAQVELYGPVDERLFGGIIRYVRILSRRRGDRYAKAMRDIQELIGPYINDPLFSPKEETFLYYKHQFADSFPELHHVLNGIRVAEKYSIEEIVQVFERALAAIGANLHGWRVVVVRGGANIIASKYKKKVIIGDRFHPRSSVRLKQVVAHEVGCHVQRALTDRQAWHYARFDENDEGLAILLEQLFAKRFMYKRVLRYLAISLATGVDGKKRNFCEVYEILWRAAYIIGGNGPKTAKQQAFYETARAFRGGLPNVAGAAYIKDKIYLEGNIIVWEKLEAERLGLINFKRLFRGHNNKIAKEIVP